jgi:hypothetical protein
MLSVLSEDGIGSPPPLVSASCTDKLQLHSSRIAASLIANRQTIKTRTELEQKNTIKEAAIA